MPYEINKDRYHNMDKGRTLGLISACDIEIPIYKCDYSYFINDNNFRNGINNAENQISNIFSDSKYKEKFINNLHLSLLPDFYNDNFFLGYSPRDIIRSIYNILGITENFELEYSNPIKMQLVKNSVKETINHKIEELSNDLKNLRDEFKKCDNNLLFMQLNKEYNLLDNKINFAIESLNHIDYIFNLYNYREVSNYSTCRVVVSGSKAKNEEDYHIKWRNLSQYIAIISLREYEKTNNKLYLEYPYKFYERCSKPDEKGNQMLYVDELYLEDELLDSNFINFNKRCEDTFKNSPIRIEFILNYKDNNKITVFETLKPSSLLLNDDDFGDFISYKAGKSRVVDKNIEYLKAEKQLASKTKFYAYNTDFSDHVLSRMYLNEKNETGYVGFILDNDYIVLDKFFKESLDGECVPAKDSAIYALPISMYEELGRDSGNIRAFKKANPNCPLVLHKYHTEKESYQPSLLELTTRESASKIKAEDFIKYNGGRVSKIINTSKKKTLKHKKKKD